MCLILLAWQAHSRYPLVVAANRDEFYSRPAQPAHFWEDQPAVLAGRDLVAGGTWLGITRHGRFAALTNFRDPAAHRRDAPSRGRLVADFLREEKDIDDYLAGIAPQRYNGFNLLLGDGRRLVAFSNVTNERRELPAGVHGLSNAVLDTPWPKVGAAKAAMQAALARLPDESLFWAFLCDRRTYPDHLLPATGVPLAWERLLSAAFIVSETYGTRASTVITVATDGMCTFSEQSWQAGGRPGTRRRFRFRLGTR